jgi:hypothetical protein
MSRLEATARQVDNELLKLIVKSAVEVEKRGVMNAAPDVRSI